MFRINQYVIAKILSLVAVYLLASQMCIRQVSAGLIFDNGSGNKNDTLVIQFCMLDSIGRGYIDWDTAYVVQAYGGLDFNIDTLTTPGGYDISGTYPRNLMFEYRLRASDNSGDIGAYTWWVYLIETTGGDVKQMQKGSYYVSDDPVEEMLAQGDTANASALGKMVRDAIRDSIPSTLAARVDSLRNSIGMPTDTSGVYANNLHRKLGAYSGQMGDNNNIRDDIASLSLTGSGSESCTLTVQQNGGGSIFGARLQIRTLNQVTTRVPGLFTDTNGRGIAELDAGSYYISIMANNYEPFSDTLVVGRDSTWIMSMAPFDPGEPPSPDLCRVYGWVYDITGERLSDVTISAEIPSDYHPVRYGDVIITPFRRSISSDSTGYWEIDLFPNQLLSDPESKYLFTIEYPSGVILRSQVAVPDYVWWQFRNAE